MATIDDAALYDDLLDLLAESADAERVLAFRLSDAKQEPLGRLARQESRGDLDGGGDHRTRCL